ncbi:MAG: substrate-binding domain-containing protein, partial [Dehalococcoidales bacterium]|nr:substrate-binding domain-containing protein [Dehalococcoidales bacterium]
RLIRLGLRNAVDLAGAYEVVRRMLGEDLHFTAIFVHSGLVAPGVLLALREAGLRVPQDVALVGQGDFPIAPYLEVPLTCVRNPTPEMGARAVELLLRRIGGERPEQPEKVILSPELVIRRSCGAKLSAGIAQPGIVLE